MYDGTYSKRIKFNIQSNKSVWVNVQISLGNLSKYHITNSPFHSMSFKTDNTMLIHNLILAIKDQLPLKRLLINFFITRNAWGMFHKNSHIAVYSGKPKVPYPTKESASKAANSMSNKKGVHFSCYKCVWCNGYHIGKNRENKNV